MKSLKEASGDASNDPAQRSRTVCFDDEEVFLNISSVERRGSGVFRMEGTVKSHNEAGNLSLPMLTCLQGNLSAKEFSHINLHQPSNSRDILCPPPLSATHTARQIIAPHSIPLISPTSSEYHPSPTPASHNIVNHYRSIPGLAISPLPLPLPSHSGRDDGL